MRSETDASTPRSRLAYLSPPGESGSDALLRSLSVLLDRQKFANRAGLSFSTSAVHATGWERDLFVTLGYPETLTTDDYEARYQRGGIAERIVETYPRATWGGGASLVEDPDPGQVTPFEAAAAELFDRLDIWARLLRADILAGLGRYSVLLIGDNRGALTQPFERVSGPEALLYLTPLPESKAAIKDQVKTTENPRFGLPESYRLDLGGVAQNLIAPWSRVIHIAEARLENDLYGRPRLRACWNYLQDLDKIIGGGSEAAWIRMDPGLHVKMPLVDKDTGAALEFDADEETALQDELDDYQHKLKRRIQTRGVEIDVLSAPVTAFGANADALLKLIASTTGIPHRILIGSERGELASTQDRFNFSARTTERRQEFAVPVTRDLVDRLIEAGALPTPSEYAVIWPEIDELDESEKAKVADRLASANQKQAVAEGSVLVTADEIRDRVLGLGPLAEAGGGSGLQTATRRLLQAKRTLSPRQAQVGWRAGEDFDLADKPAAEPEWKAIHRAADAHRESLARVFLGAWQDAADGIEASALLEALENGNGTAAVQVVFDALAVADESLAGVLPDRLLAVLTDGALASLRSARARGSLIRSAEDQSPNVFVAAYRWLTRRSGAFALDFDATNPRAVDWAAFHSSELVTGVGEATRAAIRAYIAQGILLGTPPRVLARELRSILGLRVDQVEAVGNLLDRLLQAKPGDLVMAGKTRIRIPKTGITEALARQRSREYAGRLLRQRALLIARTETIAASSQGQAELWRQATDKGLLGAEQKRVWIVTPDDRLDAKVCQPMTGQVRGMEEPFETGKGGAVMYPPAHPGCRCAVGLATPEDIERAEREAA